MKVKKVSLSVLACMFIALSVSLAHAGPITYNNRATFEAQLATLITDDYSAAGYSAGDVLDAAFLDIHSNSQMSSIFGETIYTSTSFNEPTGWNIITDQDTNPRYCTGCNGSFILDFTATSVGDSSGVFGAGFDFRSLSDLIYAFVTLGDGATFNSQLTGTGFFGVTATESISSIAVGLFDGGTTQSESISIDNVTIGNVPEPTTLALMGLGLAGLGISRKRSKS